MCGRSRRSQRETRVGSVDRMTSSKPCMLTASWIALSGSGSPIRPSTRRPAASDSSGSASSSVVSASERSWSSGLITLAAGRAPVLGTSSVNVQGPRAARSRTAPSSAGVAAVLFATTRTRAGGCAVAMRLLLFDTGRALRPDCGKRHDQASRAPPPGRRGQGSDQTDGPSAANIRTTSGSNWPRSPIRRTSARRLLPAERVAVGPLVHEHVTRDAKLLLLVDHGVGRGGGGVRDVTSAGADERLPRRFTASAAGQAAQAAGCRGVIGR